MSKKNKTAKVNNTEVKNTVKNTTVEQLVDKTPKVETTKTKKEDEPKTNLKEKKVPPASGVTIETPIVEEVKKEEKKVTSAPPAKATVRDLINTFTDNDYVDANHAAVLLDTLERRTSKMDRSKPITIQMESLLDYNLMWAATKFAVQTYKQRDELKMLTPNDEFIVQQAIDTASAMGVALEAHVDPSNPAQQVLEFKEISDETKKAAEEEIAAEKAEKTVSTKHTWLTPEQLDPSTWKTDDDARAALRQEMMATHESPSNKFLRILGKIRLYKENTETDPLKKDLWNKCSLTDLADEYQRLLDKKGMMVINGLMNSTVNSLKCGETMIFAHCLLRKNMPALHDNELAELVKMFIKIKHGDSTEPLDQDLAVTNGILKPNADTFVRIAMEQPDKTQGEDINWFKKVNNVLFTTYKEDIGSRVVEDPATKTIAPNPDYKIKSVNKMIEIRNLYVDEKSRIPLFTMDEWMKAISGK